MDLKDTLSKLDAILTPATPAAPQPKQVLMTAAQFEAHVTDQVAKAKADYANEKDKTKGAKKAKKRLEILRNTVAHIAKTDFGGGAPGLFGDNGVKIPVFEESDITRFAEMSEKEWPTPPTGGPGMADTSYAQPGGAQSFADAGAGGGGGGPSGGAALPMIGGTAGDNGAASWAASGGQADFAKAFDALKKTIDEATAGTAPTVPALPAAAVPEASTFDWPKDLAATEEVIGKEAVTKRAPESWGKDAAVATK